MAFTINKYNGAKPRYNVTKGSYKRTYIAVHYTGSGTASTPNIARNNCVYFSGGNRNASADFFIDNSSIWQFNDPKYGYTWNVGDGGGRYRPDGKVYMTNANTIGIEVASKGADFTTAEKERLRFLVQKLMKDYGIDAKHVVRHYDASRKTCPRPYSGSSANDKKWKALHEYITASEPQKAKKQPPVLTGSELKKLSDNKARIKAVAPVVMADMVKSGVLASVTLAQFCLESTYGTSELATMANNCFGMKKSISGNTWPGTAWDGATVYRKATKEQKKDGTYKTVFADFRAYQSVRESIADHSAYLLGAMNGSKKRYAGIKGCTGYAKALRIVKAGGYATSINYVSNCCAVVERWSLNMYDCIPGEWKMLKGTNIRTGRDESYKVAGHADEGSIVVIEDFKVDSQGRVWGKLGKFRWVVVSSQVSGVRAERCL